MGLLGTLGGGLGDVAGKAAVDELGEIGTGERDDGDPTKNDGGED